MALTLIFRRGQGQMQICTGKAVTDFLVVVNSSVCPVCEIFIVKICMTLNFPFRTGK